MTESCAQAILKHATSQFEGALCLQNLVTMSHAARLSRSHCHEDIPQRFTRQGLNTVKGTRMFCWEGRGGREGGQDPPPHLHGTRLSMPEQSLSYSTRQFRWFTFSPCSNELTRRTWTGLRVVFSALHTPESASSRGNNIPCREKNRKTTTTTTTKFSK